MRPSETGAPGSPGALRRTGRYLARCLDRHASPVSYVPVAEAVLLANFLKYVRKNESGLIMPHFFVEPVTNQPFAGVDHNEPGNFRAFGPLNLTNEKAVVPKVSLSYELMVLSATWWKTSL